MSLSQLASRANSEELLWELEFRVIRISKEVFMADKDNSYLNEDGETPSDSPGFGSGLPRFAADRIANKNHLLFSRRLGSLLLPLLLVVLLVILGAAGAYYFFSGSSVPDDLEMVSVGLGAGQEGVGVVIPDLKTEVAAVPPKQVTEQPLISASDPGSSGKQTPKPPLEKASKPSPPRILEPTHRVVKNKPWTASPGQSRNTDRYVLHGGVFVVPTNLAAAEKTIRALGFEPHHKSGRKPVKMIRLRVGHYSPEEGQARVQELQKVVPGAFLLKDGGQVVIYAGSYHGPGKAAGSAEALSRQGVLVEEEIVEVVLPVTTLTFGGFPDMLTARQAAERARRHGLAISIVKQ